jgi:hypothetical protein
VGVQTGSKYQMAEADHFSIETTSGASDGTFTTEGVLIGQGQNTNTTVHLVFHYTIDASGTPTVTFDHVEVSCH